MSEGRDVKAHQNGTNAINELIKANREGGGPLPVPFLDVREFFAGIGEHKCDGQPDIHSKDLQGTTVANTYIGFECKTCNFWFMLPLSVAKAIQRPLRPYFQSDVNQVETARRFNEDPAALLLEMRNSGGWAQPDPGVALLTAMAAVFEQTGKATVHGEGPMAALHKMMKGSGKPQ